MIFNKPKTLVRVGRYDNSLDKAVEHCSINLARFPFGLGNTVKYGTFNEEESYLLIVSQQKDKILTLPTGYNVILTVTSYYDAKNKEVSDRFEKETGMNLSRDILLALKGCPSGNFLPSAKSEASYNEIA